MMKLYSLLLCAGLAPAQDVAPQPPDPVPTQLISYRIRLSAQDVNFSLRALNTSGKRGTLLVRGLTPDLERRPHRSDPVTVEPGQTVVMDPALLAWTEYSFVYVEASRGLELSLLRTGLDSNGGREILRIPLDAVETVYDIVSASRLSDIQPNEYHTEVSALGSRESQRMLKPFEQPYSFAEGSPKALFLLVARRSKPSDPQD